MKVLVNLVLAGVVAAASQAQVMVKIGYPGGQISSRMSPIGPSLRHRPEPMAGRSLRRSRLVGYQLAQARQVLPAKTRGWFGKPGKPASAQSAAPDVTRALQSLQPYASGGAATTLVLYDSRAPYGFVGDIYAREVATLLSHFGRSVNLQPVEEYQAGQMQGFDQTFYLGVLYDNALPAAFKSDALATNKPLCWMGYNLWQIAWTPDWSGNNPAFVNKYGFRFKYIEDGTLFPKITYKGKSLDNSPWSGGLGRVQIADTTKATAVSRAKADDGTTMPYLVKGANLWYVSENPLQDSSTWTRADRSLVFEDVLHDIVGSTATEQHKAFLRIEDVHPQSDPAALRAIADVLGTRGIPFVICVIPQYEDPLGFWNNGDPLSDPMTGDPEFLSALRYMESKGGEVLMHGVTHQYNAEHNPGSGVSGDDYEFFRMVDEGGGNVVPYGPVWEDSPQWVANRLDYGLGLFQQAGFQPRGWNTPHYLASPTDYQAFAQRFQYSTCRGKFFTLDSAGYLYWIEMENPYPVVDDLGMLRMPETLGYVSTPELGTVGALPRDLVAHSDKVKVVRDGWAGCFFHWFLPPSMLEQLVDGIRGKGYQFVSPDDALSSYSN